MLRIATTIEPVLRALFMAARTEKKGDPVRGHLLACFLGIVYFHLSNNETANVFSKVMGGTRGNAGKQYVRDEVKQPYLFVGKQATGSQTRDVALSGLFPRVDHEACDVLPLKVLLVDAIFYVSSEPPYGTSTPE